MKRVVSLEKLLLLSLAPFLAILAESQAVAQSVPELRDIKLLKGQCGPETHVGMAPAGSEDFDDIPFSCDTAIVSYHEPRGSLMITFVKAGEDSTRAIGYAGTMKDREMLHVERVYLALGDKPYTPNDGYCKLFWTGKVVSGIACGAQIDAEGKRVVPIVAFKTP